MSIFVVGTKTAIGAPQDDHVRESITHVDKFERATNRIAGGPGVTSPTMANTRHFWPKRGSILNEKEEQLNDIIVYNLLDVH